MTARLPRVCDEADRNQQVWDKSVYFSKADGSVGNENRTVPVEAAVRGAHWRPPSMTRAGSGMGMPSSLKLLRQIYTLSELLKSRPS